MAIYKAIGASDGIAIASVYKLIVPRIDIPNTKIQKQDVHASLEKVKLAFIEAIKQLEIIKTNVKQKIDEEHAAIFQAHIEILNDPTILNDINTLISHQLNNEIYSVNEVFEKTENMFANMDDSYFKERAADIHDLKLRILSILSKVELPNLLAIDKDVIIVATELTPSQTSLLNKKFVKGFVTSLGGRTSHTAIMARTLEIPAILGLTNIENILKQDEVIAIDGNLGIVQNQLTELETKEWNKKHEIFLKEKLDLQHYLAPIAITKDKHEVIVCANIGSPDDMDGVIKYGGKGVGLFRTEFLYMDNVQWPTEDQQFDAYKTVIQKANNELVIIRTLDIGGDKNLPYHKFEREENPFLGYRAIRFCLDNLEIFKTQLRALLRASAFGSLGIMFPMIATIEELIQAKNIVNECVKELELQKIVIGKPLIGIMIEIPAAAMLSDLFAKHVDFFSIGTNDLIQYTFAVDRMSPSVSYLYQPLNPSLLRLIKNTIDGGHKCNVWTGMCGEMAGDPMAIPLLLGLGLKEFSMTASSMLKAKKIIANLNYSDCVKLVDRALICETDKEVSVIVKQFLQSNNIKIE